MVTPAMFARLVAQFTPQPPEPAPPRRDVPVVTSVYSAGDLTRERHVLADPAALTAVTDPWTAATTLFGGTR